MIVAGQEVIRWLAGTIPMKLIVTAVTDDRIICGPYTFDKKTGAEIDEEIGWGPPPEFMMTGSYIKIEGVKYTQLSDEEALANLDKMREGKN